MANHTLNAPAASAKASGWNVVVSAYRNAASERNAAAPSDWKDAAQESAWEILVDRASKALSAVTAYPVTTLAQLAEKCELVKAEYPDAMHLDGDDCAAIIADVQRIATDQHAARLANGGAAWDSALAAYEAAQAAVDAIPITEDEGAWNAADTMRADAAFTLATTPVPDRAALLLKSEQLFGEAADRGEWGPTWHPEMIASYMADMRRLAAVEG
ncbi:hypothetical protein [Sphingomonas sp. 10B4]|uniref:hypothetical protein n=1 Tax=Sphingomonas sp. 10B4 TaxID=3048575 RepID=UPI002AB43A0D|nr:hypothetical protein [Sphingomonas sp. 10B4]MDY7525862.1 hypothetical protein [Sphingomonas sp. 10B4]MEB0284398.1 hypothetical protein [Sphingomonas sp. 10B4]